MIKSSPWPKLLPPLGIVLALACLRPRRSRLVDGQRTRGRDPELGAVMTMTQAARAEARRPLPGSGAFAALERASELIEETLAAARASASAAASQLLAAPDWATVSAALGTIVAAGEAWASFTRSAPGCSSRAPGLLIDDCELRQHIGACGSARQPDPPRALRARGRSAPAECARACGVDRHRRLAPAARRHDQFLGQILRRPRGSDASLGITAVTATTRTRNLDAVSTLFEEMRATSGRPCRSADDAHARSSCARRVRRGCEGAARGIARRSRSRPLPRCRATGVCRPCSSASQFCSWR